MKILLSLLTLFALFSPLVKPDRGVLMDDGGTTGPCSRC